MSSSLVFISRYCPRVPIKSYGSFKRLILRYKRKVIYLTFDFRIANIFYISDFLSHLACQVFQVEVISEAFTEKVNDSLTKRRALLRSDTEYLWLRVVMETCREYMPIIAIRCHCEIYIAEIVGSLFCSCHLTSDLSPWNIGRLRGYVVKSAQRISIVSKSESFNDDIVASAISRSTLRESSSDWVECEGEVVVVIVHSIESHLHLNCDTLTPATRWWTQ